tara:strand:+ start:1819 stop:1935 length:117 start_codon:yes stop_codon:yes gene_type:complete
MNKDAVRVWFSLEECENFTAGGVGDGYFIREKRCEEVK